MALATTYHPRGEIGRLQRLYPRLQEVYSDIIVSLPPVTKAEDVEAIKALAGARVYVNAEWGNGRYQALKAGLECGADTIHYADMDRLIRWMETRPDEWLRTVEQVRTCDCLVIGRTEAAWATHPQVMIQVERTINLTFSYLLGKPGLDFGAGSKGFSRRAVEFLMQHTQPGRALGTDTEWPILLHRAGYTVEGVLVDGLDWEIPDQYQDEAADAERQRRMAADYDDEVQHWKQRVRGTVEVFEAGLDAMQRRLNGDR